MSRQFSFLLSTFKFRLLHRFLLQNLQFPVLFPSAFGAFAVKPSVDDILFSEIRPANKRYTYVDFDSSDYVVSTKFMIIRGSKEIRPRLLYRILTAKETLNEFQVQAESRSGTFPQITFDSISHLSIVLPPIEIQEAFQRTVQDGRPSQSQQTAVPHPRRSARHAAAEAAQR